MLQENFYDIYQNGHFFNRRYDVESKRIYY